MTSETVQQYIRVLIYMACGAAVQYGWITSDNKTVIAGVLVNIANLAWTIYGTRFIAKVNELAKYDVVQSIVVASQDVAQNTPSAKVTTKL